MSRVKCKATVVTEFDVDVEIIPGSKERDPDRLLRMHTNEVATDIGLSERALGEVVKKRLQFEKVSNFRISQVDVEKKGARRSSRRSSRR